MPERQGKEERAAKGILEKVEGRYPQVNGEGKIVLEKRRDKRRKGKKNFSALSCGKANAKLPRTCRRLSERQKGKRKEKGTVYCTLSGRKATVKVLTGFEEMWYSVTWGKAGNIKKQRRKFAVEERKKSFLIVKIGEILSIFLTIFCKGFKRGWGKIKLGKRKIPHKKVRDSERENALKKALNSPNSGKFYL